MDNGKLISDLREYADSVLTSLSDDDRRISGAVQLTFTDQTRAVIGHAFTELAGEWLFVFSLTDGYFLFRRSEVLKWTAQSTPVMTELSQQPIARGMMPCAA